MNEASIDEKVKMRGGKVIQILKSAMCTLLLSWWTVDNKYHSVSAEAIPLLCRQCFAATVSAGSSHIFSITRRNRCAHSPTCIPNVTSHWTQSNILIIHKGSRNMLQRLKTGQKMNVSNKPLNTYTKCECRRAPHQSKLVHAHWTLFNLYRTALTSEFSAWLRSTLMSVQCRVGRRYPSVAWYREIRVKITMSWGPKSAYVHDPHVSVSILMRPQQLSLPLKKDVPVFEVSRSYWLLP